MYDPLAGEDFPEAGHDAEPDHNLCVIECIHPAPGGPHMNEKEQVPG